MALWRCLNEACADADGPPVHDFEAPDADKDPACPTCGTTRKQAPNLVVERACLHYLVNDPAGPIRTPHGGRQVPCMPLLARLPKYATGHPAAVTCPKCLASAVLKEHVAGEVVQHTNIIQGVPSGPPE